MDQPALTTLATLLALAAIFWTLNALL